MSNHEDIDQRLARLEGETAALRPTSGFSARVMLAIGADAAPSFFETTWFSARRMLPVAAFAAALAVIWAVQVEGAVDDDLATTYASEGFE